ncbi:MAG: hypothetical protein JO068_09180 [Hyphomicrobiales bacterium]|nr:hypothetical protein [Hyphomicrobiales bacterium]
MLVKSKKRRTGARPWWQDAVIYQVYPRSFQDSNGDGIGDLKGIIERADYFSWLGVDAVWFSPFFNSPMVDFGYDISNYLDIDPSFGTLAEFDQMVAALHARGIPPHRSGSRRRLARARSEAHRAWRAGPRGCANSSRIAA